nr:MAG TPA: hypothetical protein [Crassvirales sp.]
MNKVLVIGVLTTYMAINDGCLSVVTYEHTYNDCRVQAVDLNFVYILDKDDIMYQIDINEIIDIQFADHMALVGMK